MRVLSLLLLLPALAWAGDKEDLTQCVEELEQHAQKLHHRIPNAVFTSDRKLYYMTEAIPFLSANRSLVQLSSVLMANSSLGCRQFQDRYSARAIWFQSFLFSLLFLVGTLTLRIINIIFSAPSFSGVGNAIFSHSSPSIPSRPEQGDGEN